MDKSVLEIRGHGCYEVTLDVLGEGREVAEVVLVSCLQLCVLAIICD
jgi:hypothetical protein